MPEQSLRKEITELVDSIAYDPSYGESGRHEVPKIIDAILTAIKKRLPTVGIEAGNSCYCYSLHEGKCGTCYLIEYRKEVMDILDAK